MKSCILHLDMDAFYASVEQHDRPELRGRPVLVGGSLGRGVVAACSYEARRYGVHSAMAMARALSLCPRAVALPVRMERYQEVSRQVFAIFARYTDRVEPLSIDEAFLDVSGCERLFGRPALIAEAIRDDVRQETGLAISAGVAPNKFLAKLASEAGKPDGLMEVPPEEVDAFLLPLPLRALWGVGKTTAAKLERFGLRTVSDLRGVPRERLVEWLGRHGEHLYRLARGQDDRLVESRGGIKSVGHEETFSEDLRGGDVLRLELLALAEKVASRLRSKGLAGRCVTLKVKYADFVAVTRSITLGLGVDNALEIHREAVGLLRRTEAGRRPVRLLGISLSELRAAGAGQQDLFDHERERARVLDRTVDEVRERFGSSGVRRGSLLPRPSGGKKGSDGGQGA